MSSWRPDSPVELLDGTLCCKAHHRVYCVECCVDYSFMQDSCDENEDSSDEDSSDQTTGFSLPQVSPTELAVSEHPGSITRIMRFSPSKSTDTPQTLFAQGHRFICRSNQKHILIYTDGACLNNGQPSATAGCAFVFRPSSSAASINGTVSFRLETQGPSGAVYPQTSNRAELRAVIAALQFRCWYGEGWTQLVIATDSEYVVSGATEWVQSWVRNGWLTSKNTPVKNRDLWELLLQEVQRSERSLRVVFWRIPREWNQVADRGAKEAAAERDGPKEYCKIHGFLV